MAASQTAAEYVYDSVSRTDEEAQRMLDNVISIVVPSINPDGTQMIADWYMKYVGTPYEAAGLPWLYQKYSGHDNNRDGFALNLPESQNLAKLMYRDWMPQAYVDHHQMGSGNARLYIRRTRSRSVPTAIRWSGARWRGGARTWATKLEAAGKTGVIGNAIYSGWGHMGFHWITPFHNIAGMLTESASARLATPLYIHPDSLRGGPRNLPEYETQTNMPSLWPGGWWRVRDIVEQQKIAAWATVDLAARNREVVLWNMYLKGTRQTERGGKGDVKAYAIAMPQHDPLTARKLVNMLLNSGVEVQQVTAPDDDRRPRLRARLLRRLDGAAEVRPRAVDARPHFLSRQHVHARPAGQSDPPVRHGDRHVRRVHGRPVRSAGGARHPGTGEGDDDDVAAGSRGGERAERLRRSARSRTTRSARSHSCSRRVSPSAACRRETASRRATSSWPPLPARP